MPAPLQTIDVPSHLAASMLGGWHGCVAKLALSSQRIGTSYMRLAGGPAAAKGVLAHRVLEQWMSDNEQTDPGAIFTAEYERLQTELQSDPAQAQFADLAEVFGRAEWNGFRAWILLRCQDTRLRIARRHSNNSLNEATKQFVTGVEVPLTSDALRLKGRADRIRRVAENVFEIRDFKSGAVLDDDGAVKEGTALQLQAYGLMFLETNPGTDLLLVVDIGRELQIPFDDEARESARGKIEALSSIVPSAGSRSMGELARPGSDCLGCRARHVCTAYLHKAPEWWLAFPRNGDRVSNDSWGTVAEVRTGAVGVDVTLTDAVGRRVRINGLDQRHGIAAPAVGQQLWLFELESSGPAKDFKGQRYHPRVFHELPRDRRERRAWSAQAFLGS